MSDITIPDTDDYVDDLQEVQWVAESIARDLRERAQFFGQFKRYRAWADFMNADADLLDLIRSRLKRQRRVNPYLMSRSTGAQS